jgi:hypothetical protein
MAFHEVLGIQVVCCNILVENLGVIVCSAEFDAKINICS